MQSRGWLCGRKGWSEDHVRNGDSSSPVVNQAALCTLTDAIGATNLEGPSGVQQVHHISKGLAITLGVLAVVPIIVIPIVATRVYSHTNSSPVPADPVRLIRLKFACQGTRRCPAAGSFCP